MKSSRATLVSAARPCHTRARGRRQACRLADARSPPFVTQARRAEEGAWPVHARTRPLVRRALWLRRNKRVVRAPELALTRLCL